MNRVLNLWVLLTCGAVLHGFAADEKGLSSEEFVKLVGKLEALTLVTAEPVSMRSSSWALCRNPQPGERDHGALLKSATARKLGGFYKTYVTPGGAEAIKAEKSVFPEGTMIVKKKFVKGSEDSPELFTVMLKRERGFNPEAGDWEFITLSGDAKTVTSRGKQTSCIECHRLYKDHDFVTKNYK
jgi:hypothetical protein